MENYNSKVFWHFTGSPDLSNLTDEEWEGIRSPIDVIRLSGLRPREDAWNALKGIVESKELWATATEKLYGNKETDKFCCVTDIPLIYLSSHRVYYGDFAIGYNSTMVYRHFNPVLYYNPLHIKLFAAEKRYDKETLNYEELRERGNLEDYKEDEISYNEEDDTWTILTPTPYFDETRVLSEMERNLLNYLKPSFYSDEPGNSFYREREWRKIGDFNFNHEDVAAIIVPQSHIDKASDFLSGIDKANGISLMSWELLEKTL